jgi:UPF0716 protein FxsA
MGGIVAVGSLAPVPILILLLIVVPLVELYVIIQVGQAIGVVPTILLLLADSILGSLLLRSQGRAAWTRFNRALAENRMPAKEVFDGALIIFGGALLLTPGFVTDIFGMLLLIPPTRAAIRRIAGKTVLARFTMGPRAAAWGYGQMRDRRAARDAPRQAPPPPFTGPPPPRPRRNVDGDVIDGTAQEVRDEDALEQKTGREPPHPDGPGSFGG